MSILKSIAKFVCGLIATYIVGVAVCALWLKWDRYRTERINARRKLQKVTIN